MKSSLPQTRTFSAKNQIYQIQPQTHTNTHSHASQQSCILTKADPACTVGKTKSKFLTSGNLLYHSFIFPQFCLSCKFCCQFCKLFEAELLEKQFEENLNSMGLVRYKYCSIRVRLPFSAVRRNLIQQLIFKIPCNLKTLLFQQFRRPTSHRIILQ